MIAYSRASDSHLIIWQKTQGSTAKFGKKRNSSLTNYNISIWGNEKQGIIEHAKVQVDFGTGLAHPCILECIRNLMLLGIGQIAFIPFKGPLSCDTTYYLIAESQMTLEELRIKLAFINPDCLFSIEDRTRGGDILVSLQLSESSGLRYKSKSNEVSIRIGPPNVFEDSLIGSQAAQLVINILTGSAVITEDLEVDIKI